jgi:phosphoglycolate phosphatase-like HAD superfamily hydrolase
MNEQSAPQQDAETPAPAGSSVSDPDRRELTLRLHGWRPPRRIDAVGGYSWRLVAVIVAGSLVLGMLLAVRAILLALLLATLLSTLLVPVSDWLRRRGARPALAALGGALLLVAVGVGAALLVTRSVVTQWTEISADIGKGVDQLTADEGDALGLDERQAADLDNEIRDLWSSASDVLLTGALQVVPVVAEMATTVALALFILFFLLKDGRTMWAWALQRLPLEHRLADELGLASWRVLAAYLRGMAVVAAVDALAIRLGLLLLDVPFVGAIVVLTFFAAFIPPSVPSSPVPSRCSSRSPTAAGTKPLPRSPSCSSSSRSKATCCNLSSSAERPGYIRSWCSSPSRPAPSWAASSACCSQSPDRRHRHRDVAAAPGRRVRRLMATQRRPQLPYLTGEIDESPRHELFCYGEHDLFAIRYNNSKVHFQTKDDWFGGAIVRPTVPKPVNLRVDPFEQHMDAPYHPSLHRREGVDRHARGGPRPGACGHVNRRGRPRMAADPLTTWKDSPSKEAIFDFVRRVCGEQGSPAVPLEERVAVFDNDGTLWCEKPMPIQLDFILRRLVEMAEAQSELRERQPWKAAYERDYGWLSAVMAEHYAGNDTNVRTLAAGILAAYEGISVENLEELSDAFLRSAQHPTLGRGYLECAYPPMVELLGYLEANGFSNYIASGGGRDFMRPISQDVYGIPRERVIGSSAALAYTDNERGGRITHKAEADYLDDGPEKPVRIWSRTGRRPLLAAGNSNGDIPMLHFTFHDDRPTLRLLILHDDGEREFDYTAGAERALEQAAADGWTVVSIKNDWSTVFSPAVT